jgi:hypothetical protein
MDISRKADEEYLVENARIKWIVLFYIDIKNVLG